jgi:serine/threonine protein kinase
VSRVSAPPHTVGSSLGSRYEVVGLIDRGSKHEVYDVWSKDRRCRCVVKTVAGEPPYDPGTVRRLLLEGRLLRRMTHPHLVRAYEVIRDPRPLVILETLTGESLSHVIERLERLALGDVGVLGLQLCSAAAYLHDQGWLHLDLKPSNIVSASGTAKVLDLGLARRPGRARSALGTRGYLSPEQSRGGRLSPASDVWGIGVVMFEAATGTLPYEDSRTRSASDADISFETEDPIQPLVEAPPSIRTRRRTPRAFAEIVDRCLALDPAERPSVRQLADELAGITGIDPRVAGAPSPETRSGSPRALARPAARG